MLHSRISLKWLVILAAVFYSLPLAAQYDSEFEPVDSSRRKMMGGAGYFTIGLTQMDLTDLNLTLRESKFGEFNTNFLSTGGGGYGIIKNWVIGGEGFYFTKQKTTDSNRTASIKGSNGMFKLGYVILSKKGFYLYPVVGVGGGILEMQLKESDSVPTFPDIAANPGRSAYLSANGLILDAGLGISYTPKGGVTGDNGCASILRDV